MDEESILLVRKVILPILQVFYLLQVPDPYLLLPIYQVLSYQRYNLGPLIDIAGFLDYSVQGL